MYLEKETLRYHFDKMVQNSSWYDQPKIMIWHTFDDREAFSYYNADQLIYGIRCCERYDYKIIGIFSGMQDFDMQYDKICSSM